ncbi:hypothetical protein M153_2090009003 [Pseudoloma neurophilia]|uniref:Uncharacterized protein n=1 Tax=Pseudoloma neurophilia TaxID=146866 RepID=A0A0R0M350_9MICR|nr:hypothetical protein M153_2090009003 [Pseudoloma neurophilia]
MYIVWYGLFVHIQTAAQQQQQNKKYQYNAALLLSQVLEENNNCVLNSQYEPISKDEIIAVMEFLDTDKNNQAHQQHLAQLNKLFANLETANKALNNYYVEKAIPAFYQSHGTNLLITQPANSANQIETFLNQREALLNGLIKPYLVAQPPLSTQSADLMKACSELYFEAIMSQKQKYCLTLDNLQKDIQAFLDSKTVAQGLLNQNLASYILQMQSYNIGLPQNFVIDIQNIFNACNNPILTQAQNLTKKMGDFAHCYSMCSSIAFKTIAALQTVEMLYPNNPEHYIIGVCSAVRNYLQAEEQSGFFSSKEGQHKVANLVNDNLSKSSFQKLSSMTFSFTNLKNFASGTLKLPQQTQVAQTIPVQVSASVSTTTPTQIFIQPTQAEYQAFSNIYNIIQQSVNNFGNFTEKKSIQLMLSQAQYFNQANMSQTLAKFDELMNEINTEINSLLSDYRCPTNIFKSIVEVLNLDTQQTVKMSDVTTIYSNAHQAMVRSYELVVKMLKLECIIDYLEDCQKKQTVNLPSQPIEIAKKLCQLLIIPHNCFIQLGDDLNEYVKKSPLLKQAFFTTQHSVTFLPQGTVSAPSNFVFPVGTVPTSLSGAQPIQTHQQGQVPTVVTMIPQTQQFVQPQTPAVVTMIPQTQQFVQPQTQQPVQFVQSQPQTPAVVQTTQPVQPLPQTAMPLPTYTYFQSSPATTSPAVVPVANASQQQPPVATPQTGTPQATTTTIGRSAATDNRFFWLKGQTSQQQQQQQPVATSALAPQQRIVLGLQATPTNNIVTQQQAQPATTAAAPPKTRWYNLSSFFKPGTSQAPAPASTSSAQPQTPAVVQPVPQFVPAQTVFQPAPQVTTVPQFVPTPAVVQPVPQVTTVPQFVPAPAVQAQPAPQFVPSQTVVQPVPQVTTVPQFVPTPAVQAQPVTQFVQAQPVPQVTTVPQFVPAPAVQAQPAPQFVPAPAVQAQPVPQFVQVQPAPQVTTVPQFVPTPAVQAQPVTQVTAIPQFIPAQSHQSAVTGSPILTMSSSVSCMSTPVTPLQPQHMVAAQQTPVQPQNIVAAQQVPVQPQYMVAAQQVPVQLAQAIPHPLSLSFLGNING